MFAIKLKSIRAKKSLTLRNLADKCGLTFQAIALLEKGERQPSLETARKLAKALGVSLDKMN